MLGGFAIIILLRPVRILILTGPEILLYYTLLQALEHPIYLLLQQCHERCLFCLQEKKKHHYQQTSIFPLQQEPRLMEIALFPNISVLSIAGVCLWCAS